MNEKSENEYECIVVLDTKYPQWIDIRDKWDKFFLDNEFMVEKPNAGIIIRKMKQRFPFLRRLNYQVKIDIGKPNECILIFLRGGANG